MAKHGNVVSYVLIVAAVAVVALVVLVLNSQGSTGGAVVRNSLKCGDTDKGDWYQKQGTVKTYDSRGIVSGVYTDYCVQSSGKSYELSRTMVEYFCDSSGKVQSHTYSCSRSACSNGKCKEATLLK